MSELLSTNPTPSFESIKHFDENGEFWLARELSILLEYSDYRNFVAVMKSAAEACKNSGQQIRNHFVGVTEMVKIGSNAERQVNDVKLSRYACYLIVQNADPAKEIVAFGQTYFAVQTRIQEIQKMEQYVSLETEDEKRLFLRDQLVQHNKYLSSAAKDAGVIDPIDYAIFKNFGYKGLYNGLDRKGIQRKKGLKDTANILDHMGSTELAANLFLATQTEEKLKKDRIKSKQLANQTHFEVGKKIRGTIKEIGGTMPEDLPMAENIKAIEKSKKKLPPTNI
jgi:DNA-damage-inducible protein D